MCRAPGPLQAARGWGQLYTLSSYQLQPIADLFVALIRQARDRFDVPVAAYPLSGEFSMIVAAARVL